MRIEELVDVGPGRDLHVLVHHVVMRGRLDEERVVSLTGPALRRNYLAVTEPAPRLESSRTANSCGRRGGLGMDRHGNGSACPAASQLMKSGG